MKILTAASDSTAKNPGIGPARREELNTVFEIHYQAKSTKNPQSPQSLCDTLRALREPNISSCRSHRTGRFYHSISPPRYGIRLNERPTLYSLLK